MPISKRIHGAMQNSSWIRRMFEEGAELKARLGAGQVFDFTLGNPDLEPPERFMAELVKAAADLTPGLHNYMPNAGFLQTRQALAGGLSRIHDLEFKARDVVLTCGASGGPPTWNTCRWPGARQRFTVPTGWPTVICARCGVTCPICPASPTFRRQHAM